MKSYQEYQQDLKNGTIIYRDEPCRFGKARYKLGNRWICYGCWINYWSTGEC